MPFIWLLIVGVAVGFLATRILKVDLDTPSTIALGVLGALVGGLVLRGLVMMAGIGAGFVGARFTGHRLLAALLGGGRLVERFETFVLRSKAAVAGGVDDQQDLTGVIAERLAAAGEAIGAELV